MTTEAELYCSVANVDERDRRSIARSIREHAARTSTPERDNANLYRLANALDGGTNRDLETIPPNPGEVIAMALGYHEYVDSVRYETTEPPPKFGLPPDLVEGPEVSARAMAAPWHIPIEVYGEVWQLIEGVIPNFIGAVLDTDFANHDALPTPLAPRSFTGHNPMGGQQFHGTHCSGTMVGSMGIGVARGAQWLPVQVLSSRNGYSVGNSVAEGHRYAVQTILDNGGLGAISMSLGGGGSDSGTNASIANGMRNGIPTIAASGNEESNRISWPAAFVDCMSVGATDKNNRVANFSNQGTKLDCAAPGVSIISASNTNRSGYKSSNGTSMATPHVAGIVLCIQAMAMRRGSSQKLTMQGLRDYMFRPEFVKDIHTPGRDNASGHGIPQALRLMQDLAQGGKLL